MSADSIAVIGMACRFPGAPDLAAFRRLLRDGRDGVTDVPADRWDIDAWHDPNLGAAGKMISRRGGFIDAIRCFDHEFFGTSRNEAAWMDPQHRLLLETSWEALEDAAVTPARLGGRRVGVYVGAGGHDYQSVCAERARKTTAYSLTGNLSSLIANRVSTYFDFHGPSFTVDAACASSLVTVALACDALTAGTCDAALAGGVNVILDPHASVAMSQAWILSPEGKCRAFDVKADGYVRGEGCGVLILKRLDDALRDGDPIRMVIRGWATNHDGRGEGLTQPNASAQRTVIEEAWRRARVTARDFGYIEAFGVGSPVADVTEASALSGLFGTDAPAGPPVYIGSVKGNIGHLEAAAGAASLIKVALCLDAREVAPQVHFEALHPEVRAAGFPFTIPTAPEPWPASPAGPVAGVSAFAIGGVNVHLVVAAAPPRPPAPDAQHAEDGGVSRVLLLSARNDARLRDLARRWAGAVDTASPAEWADLCCTAATRARFAHRLAVVSPSPAAQAAALRQFAETGRADDGVWTGMTEADTTAVAAPRHDGNAAAVAAAFVEGGPVPLADRAGSDGARRSGAPTYPFARTVVWAFPITPPAAAPAGAADVPAEAPLVRLLAAVAPRRRWDTLVDRLRAAVLDVLSSDEPARLDDDTGFFELGLTSLMVMELHRRLQEAVGPGHPISPTLLFEAPTINALAAYLAASWPDLRIANPDAVAAQPERGEQELLYEPIAVLGIGCRYPGRVEDPDGFWQLLRDGVDAVTEIPADRWPVEAFFDPDPEVAGKMYTRWGGFLDGVDRFDPAFFGMSPREADTLDPQQRLVLEVAHEAIERAGLALDRLRGSRTGVFVGVGSGDYRELLLQGLDPSQLDAYAGTGNLLSGIAGRVSSVFGLQGPSMAIDTACSSSLVAVHSAVQSLRRRESDVALAGGVNLMLSPYPTIALCRNRSLSPDGRCRTFDAAANGYVRGEGCGILALKRLSDAQRDGDPITAVILGSAVNHDGPSGGFTVPSGAAQRAVIRQALADSGLSPHDVGYVEAHGTGTVLGDPIEMAGLADVYGAGRSSEEPLIVGSVKTNVGHLEAAAGVSGLTKALLAVQHGEIPPHLHLRTPNPHIPWSTAPIDIPREARAWPSGSRRVAAVSSFGITGTNAHVIVGAVPRAAVARPAPERPLHTLCVSAATPERLRAQAGRLAGWLGEHPEADPRDVAYTSNTGRRHLPCRAVVIAATTADARQRLEALGAGEASEWVVTGKAPRTRPQVGFLFAGQGTQYPGVARALYDTQPSFRKTLEACDAILQPLLGTSILSVLYATDQAGDRVHQTSLTQPILFSIQYALARLWMTWGIEPAVLLGHSFGEYVAACLAGVFDLETALRLIAARGRLVQELPDDGAMAAIMASEAAVTATLTLTQGEVSIAAVNGPEHVVVSGRRTGVNDVVRQLEAQGVRCVPLRVSHAFHSPLLDPILDAFEQAAAQETYRTPVRPLVSNLTGTLVTDALPLDAAYWRRHAREAVRFADGVTAVREHGCDILLEVGPHPVLGPVALQHPRGAEMTMLASLRRDGDAWQQMLSTLGALYVRGTAVDWHAVDGDYIRQRITLPTTPFVRARHWAARPIAAGARLQTAIAPAGHPLLGTRLKSPLRDIQFEAVHSAARPSCLGDHRINARVTSPAAAHVALMLAAVADARGWNAVVIDDLSLEQPLVIEDGDEAIVQAVLTPDGLDAVRSQVVSRRSHDGEWRVHAAAQVRRTGTGSAGPASAPEPPAVHLDAGDSLAGESLYGAFAARGLQLGEQFRWIERLWHQDGRVHGTFRAPRPGDAWDDYVLHPGLLDSYFQLASGLLAADPQDTFLWLPVRIGRIELGHPVRRAVRGYAELAGAQSEDGVLTAHIRLFDETGAPAGQIDGLQLRRVSREALRRMFGEDRRDWLYRIEWRQAPLSDEAPETAPAHWLIVGGGGATAAALESRLQTLGHSCSQYAGDTRSIGPVLDRESDAHPHGPLHLLYLAALDDGAAGADPLAQEAADAATVLALLQASAGTATHRRVALWLATRQTQAVRPGDVVRTAASGLWGLGRTIALEQPESWGGLIDLDGASPHAQAEVLLQEVTGRDRSVQAAWRDGTRYTACLARYHAARAGTFTPRADATYWITGGLRGLGWLVAERLAAGGARSLVLTGREAPSTATAEAIQALEARGVTVVVMTGDVAHADDMRRIVRHIEAGRPPLAGVFHAAGILDDDLLMQLTPERIRAVLAPKVAGAWWLHTLTRHLPLEAFVLFSSSASVLGAARQAHYAAGNAFLDTLAAHRAQQGLAALSVNFGPWNEVGMAARQTHKTWERAGVAPLPPEDSLDLLGELLAERATQAAVLRIDWPRFLPQFPGGLHGPFFADVRDAAVTHDLTAVRDELLARLDAAPLLERRDVLVAFVRESLAQVLGLDSAEHVDRDQALNELGIDSLMALELTRRLSAAAGTVLPNTLLFNQPTAQALADYLAVQVFHLAPTAPAVGSPATAAPADVEDVIRAEVDQLSVGEVSASLEDELRDIEQLLRGTE